MTKATRNFKLGPGRKNGRPSGKRRFDSERRASGQPPLAAAAA